MRIGIDIDGVITDYEKFILDYGTKFCIEEGLSLNVKTGEYDESKTFGWTEEQTIKFWNKYIVYYATEYRARDFVSQVINKLKEENHEIYIITARNDYGVPEKLHGEMKKWVEKWLKDNNINYDKIVYTEGNKLPYCVGNYVDVMIEDSPKNIKEVATKIKVLCMDCNYNKECEGENIIRVYSWYDIYEKIKNNI